MINSTFDPNGDGTISVTYAGCEVQTRLCTANFSSNGGVLVSSESSASITGECGEAQPWAIEILPAALSDDTIYPDYSGLEERLLKIGFTYLKPFIFALPPPGASSRTEAMAYVIDVLRSHGLN